MHDELTAAYWSLIEDTQETIFPDFVADLDLQDDIQCDRGRVAVFEFREGGITDTQEFSTSEALKAYLDESANSLPHATSSGYGTAKLHRLFMLEDLARDKVKLLGSRLRIPPSFFAAHWSKPSKQKGIVDRNFLPHNRHRFSRFMVPQVHRVIRDDGGDKYQLGLYKDPNSNVQRRLQLLDERSSWVTSKHQVSYWSKNDAASSWTAVLLVDPVINEAKISAKYETGESKIVHLEHPGDGDDGFPIPSSISLEPLDADHELWQNSWQNRAQVPTPCNMSMFDNVVSIYTKHTHKTDVNPQNSILPCRQVSLLMWTVYVHTKELQYYDFCNKLFYESPLNDSRGWFQSWDITWRAEAFHQLLDQQLTIGTISTDLQRTMRALGVGAKNTIIDDEETEHWEELSKSIASLNEKITQLITGYSQEASIRETRTSNYQARSVGRLASLATVLVPFSVTAAIFSMGGDFSAGQQLFWVFWVVAIPIAIILFCALFTTSAELLWKYCRFRSGKDRDTVSASAV